MTLDAALGKLLRRAADHQEKWLKERDRLIREAHAKGASLREIAAQVGLSHVGVKKIISRADSDELIDGGIVKAVVTDPEDHL